MEKCPYCINSYGDAIGPSGSDYFQCRSCSRTFEAVVDDPTSCTDCNPFCGCGQCGECAGARMPRCWEHNPPPMCTATDINGDPCRSVAAHKDDVPQLDGLCVGCYEFRELCRQHDEWYDEHGGEA